MNNDLTRSILIVSIFQGIALFLSTLIAMAAGVFLGIWLLIRVWFIPHFVSLYWDIRLFISLVVSALLSVLVFYTACAIVSYMGFTTQTCGTVSWIRAISVQLFSLGFVSGVVWLTYSVRTWWTIWSANRSGR